MAASNTNPVISLTAGADLSAKQYYLIDLDTDGDCNLAGDGTHAIGTLQNKPESGKTAAIQVAGVAKAVFSGSINPGVPVASDANGKVTTAAAGDIVVGICIVDGGADGQIGEILLHAGAEKNA